MQRRTCFLRVEPGEINIVDGPGLFAWRLPAFPMVHEVNVRIPNALDRGYQQFVRPNALALEVPRPEVDGTLMRSLRIEHPQPDRADAHSVIDREARRKRIIVG